MIQIPDDIVWEIGLCLIRRAKDVQKAWVRDVVHLSLVNRRFREILRQLCYHSFDDQWFRRKLIPTRIRWMKMTWPSIPNVNIIMDTFSNLSILWIQSEHRDTSLRTFPASLRELRIVSTGRVSIHNVHAYPNLKYLEIKGEPLVLVPEWIDFFLRCFNGRSSLATLVAPLYVKDIVLGMLKDKNIAHCTISVEECLMKSSPYVRINISKLQTIWNA